MEFRDELYFLAVTIALEAGGEPYEGKLGVAFVIKGRAERVKVSITDTIFKGWQFSAWNTEDPARMNIDSIPSEIFKECYKAAVAAFFHLSEDPSKGASHYLNEEVTRKARGGSLPGWFDESKVTIRIAHHTFLKL
jgi:spore germination cell wall hydrolase CwlJ-like protein